MHRYMLVYSDIGNITYENKQTIVIYQKRCIQTKGWKNMSRKYAEYDFINGILRKC